MPSSQLVKVVCALCLSVIIFSTNGQSRRFYVRAGLNLSTLSSSDSEYSFTPGYHIGIGGEKSLNEKLSMLHELIFSQQGANIKEDDKIQRIHYLQMPLLLKVNSSDKIYFTVGPQFSVLISSDVKSPDVPLTAMLYPLDISLSGGLSFIVVENCTLSLRYNEGLTKVIRGIDSTVRNSAIQASVSITFKKDNNE